MEELSIIIANQLKELYNKAYVMIEQKDYEKAQRFYEEAVQLSGLVQYTQGLAMAWMSLANLFLLKEDYLAAFDYAKEAENTCVQDIDGMKPLLYLRQLSQKLLKQGIEYEKKNQLGEAYQIYIKILPYLTQKHKTAVEQEIKLINQMRHRNSEMNSK